MAGTTTKYALPYPTGTDLIKDGDDKIAALANALDAIIATDDAGVLASRPTSSGGSPGKRGRYYWATDVNGGTLYRDNGTGWDVVAPDSPEAAFSTYKTLIERQGANVSGGAATYMLPGPGSVNAQAAPTDAHPYIFYFDPADYTAGSRATKFRVRAQYLTNAVAPGTTWTVGLYPVATYGGASGAFPQVSTLSAVVAGSTVAFATPGATTRSQGNSGDFAAPAAGYYVLAIVNSGIAAAGAQYMARAQLQLRQV